ncbi:unnamed protein product [Dovyalis caffra]|uniref:Ribosomal protein L32 n=1 Tax=Dovyalis caffra TaxID=77055 RepID=A0AAV1QXJ3_9ROSI|nr:unnamed protein product [Dovyalis caffra]
MAWGLKLRAFLGALENAVANLLGAGLYSFRNSGPRDGTFRPSADSSKSKDCLLFAKIGESISLSFGSYRKELKKIK